jgi:serine/threonine protein kinase
VINGYRILRVIGYGKFGAVYKAEHVDDPSRTVALKETLDPNSTRLFQREFDALNKLEHANLPHYYGSFEDGGRGYLVMEFIPGQNLLDILRRQPEIDENRRTPLPEHLVIDCYAKQICDALASLHTQSPPILHRDIKPANIRVTPANVIKLVDFGLLKFAGEKTHTDIRGIGTAPYSPLEQYSASNDLTDERSDIYSLGALLYHLLTGVTPVSAVKRIGQTPDPLLSPRHYAPDLSPHVSDAIMVSMNLSKQDRYADVTAFKRALLDPTAVNLPRTLRGHLGPVNSVDYSPDSELLVSGGDDQLVCVWKVSEKHMAQALRGHTDKVQSVAVSPDGKLIASGASDLTVRLWLAADGSEVRIFKGHLASVLTLAWHPRSTVLASGGQDNMVQVWRVSDSNLLRALRGHTEAVRGIVWSPDGKFLASASEDWTVRVWQVANGMRLHQLRGHTAPVNAVAWSPDGKTLATAGDDHTVRLWRVRDGQLLHTFRGYGEAVRSVAFSKNGQILISAGADQMVRLWCMKTGKLLRAVTGHAGEIQQVVISLDMERFAIAGSDKTIRELAL